MHDRWAVHASWVDGVLEVSGCRDSVLLAIVPVSALSPAPQQPGHSTTAPPSAAPAGHQSDSATMTPPAAAAPAVHQSDSATTTPLAAARGAGGADDKAASVPADIITTAGRWERRDDLATFRPRFPPRAGAEFVVLARERETDPWLESGRARVPGQAPQPTAAVTAIDPGSAEVPANLLRLAVTFSAEMQEGSAAGHLHLLDATGIEIEGALLEMPPELWDRRRRRLTVLLEPGRIKRGLQPNVQAGAPLQPGNTVTLAIDRELRDASGAALVFGAARTFRVGAEVRARVEPALWEVRWPSEAAGPLEVRFNRPLDRALVGRCLQVRDAGGHPVPGRSTLDDEALEWVFVPDGSGPGISGSSALHVDSRLEDLAGNSMRRVFDRDLGLPGDDRLDVGEIVLRRDPAS